MNAKTSLENRIKGWFPREPCLPRASTAEEPQYNQSLATYPKSAALSATTPLVILMAFGVVICCFAITIFASNMALTFQITLLAIGLAIGLVTGGFETQKQLNQLTKNSHTDITIKKTILSLLPITVLALPVMALNLQIGIGFMLAIQAWLVSTLAIKCAMFRTYESKKQVKIQQFGFDSGLYAFPKLEITRYGRLPMDGKSSKSAVERGGPEN